MIYIAIFLLMLVGVYAFDYRKTRQFSLLYYLFFLVVLILISGLRYRLGTDSVVYEGYYDQVPTLWELGRFKFDSTRYEPGYMVFASVAKTISPDFMMLQLLHAIVVNSVVFWFIYKVTPNRFLGLSFYFIILYFNLNMQVMREALAVCFFLLAWPSFRDGKWLWYYLLVIPATLFHSSAILMLLVPLCCLPGVRELFVFGRRTFLICILVLGIGIFIQTRFSQVFNFMAVTERMMDRVNAYSANKQSGNILNIAGMIGVVSQFCIYPLLALYFMNQNRRFLLHGRQDFLPRKNRFKLTQQEKREIREQRREQRREDREFYRWQIMVLLSVYVMIFSVPMFIFARYFNYFGLFSLCTVATWAFSRLRVGTKRIRLQFAGWVLALIPYIGFNLMAFNAPANRSGTLKVYQIYYPYKSRLNPEMDPEREAIYRYFNAR
ncbi:MAG: EpsG family protein [Muribaculaceae bacterium]|nr:EpsG family protein [Muribaculaceae bacterium]